MKQLVLALLMMTICTISYGQKNSSDYTLKVNFVNEGNDGKKVFLQGFNLNTFMVDNLDSITVEGNKFEFIGKAKEPGIKYLAFEGEENRPFANFILEPGNISISIDSITIVKGTQLNDELSALNASQYVYKKQVDSLNQVYDSANSSGAFNEQLGKELNDKFQEITGLLKHNIFEFTKKNIQNPVGEHYFVTGAGYFDYFTLDQISELLTMLRPEIRNAESVKQLETIIAVNKASQVGQPYTDIKYPDMYGKDIALSDYVGKNKLVLVDFWASWCGPCIKEMPHVKELYSTFKNKGLEIVGVSLDNDKSAWESATKRLNISWPQMSDLKGWDSVAAAAYGVRSIPMTLLLDDKGIIIAKNLRGADLQNKVSEILQ